MPHVALAVAFWIALAIVFYSYFGYGVHLWLLRRFAWARRHTAPPLPSDAECPEVALLIAASAFG